ncbi:MAG: hypothetical protein MK312_15350, partial [Roseibacillus sp.]|nr:hypothetical protein [Roseibacillus sp.]
RVERVGGMAGSSRWDARDERPLVDGERGGNQGRPQELEKGKRFTLCRYACGTPGGFVRR